ncbi:MAG TPA: L,D-transpeptidase family protein [Pyrinomonadaceae bacterium]|jgi:lipoprotein-anchoring transpeptidase ErfK/SrfK|nr:L,D-transpeptidase family protein [Pyrinomonadaceae bacterium]
MCSKLRLLICLATLCLLIGCTNTPSNSNTATVQPTPSPTASPSPTRSETASVQVTLPLLDALLTDDKFVGQLKSKLKITDDQVNQLKQASSAEIDRLRESNAEDSDGNATAARTRASEQLHTILGEEKSKELASLVNEYWSKGDVAEGSDDKNQPQMLPGPNAVPTDTRVVVNIPAFRMDLFQDGSLVKSYKVGIGYPQFPLPMGLRKANQIIFNPTWTPPDSPWVAKMKNATPGETIKAGDKDNPLGPIKIPIGLPSLIHGGKSPSRIGKFASHGCVGLTTPQVKDFALLLARASNTKDISEQSIASYLKDEERTQTVKLNQTVPVELRYETIVLEDGKLHIYKDVYAQDTNNEENLRQVLSAHGLKLEDLSEQQRSEVLDALNAMSVNPSASASPSPSASPEKKTAKTKKPAKPQNEIVIDLSGVRALAQKGYPAPVNLSRG